MKLTTFLLLAAFTSGALAKASDKELQCRQMAGETNNPTHEAVFKKCMAGPAPAAKAAAPAKNAGPAAKFTEGQCRQMAGEPGNPTYETVLKKCLATKR